MMVLRPVERRDLDQIYSLAGQTKVGLTTLPQDRDYLQERIETSVRNVAYPPVKPGGESFMFVLEDSELDRVVGTCAAFTKVGGFEPFWTYAIKSFINASKALQVSKEIQYLSLKKIHNGPSEIGTLFLTPEYRRGHNGRALSLGRFMFMGMFRRCFEQQVLAELRGYMDKNEKSIFWRSLGKHFFDMPFEQADRMSNKDKSFIADLMPRHPIYIPLLPPAAQAMIGKVHPDTVPAQKLLVQEGFQFLNEVDIFEAGPVLGAQLDSIRTIKLKRMLPIGAIGDVVPENADMCLLAVGKEPAAFRLTVGPVAIGKDSVILGNVLAQALVVQVGDPVHLAPVRAGWKHGDESKQ